MGDLVAMIAAAPSVRDGGGLEREVFGTAAPERIARELSHFCDQHMGSRVSAGRFYQGSVGCVAGVELADGRLVVIKVQRDRRGPAYLDACARIRQHLFDAGFPCPPPLLGPTALGAALATVDGLLTAGVPGDAHEPRLRRALAGSLCRVVRLARPFVDEPALGGAWLTALPEGQVWPRPHSPQFDFQATAAGATWIDDLAQEARRRRGELVGQHVVGHFDYRVEHLRFDGACVVATFDWDSLHVEREPVLVGSIAHGFTMDWHRDGLQRVPSLQEMRSFVLDYEAARGAAFSEPERRSVAVSLVYAMAYTARCNHAANPREEGWNGDLRPTLRAHGRRLLDRGLFGA